MPSLKAEENMHTHRFKQTHNTETHTGTWSPLQDSLTKLK